MSIRTNWMTRPESAGDRVAVRALTVAAFETPAEADLVDALRTDDSWIERALDGDDYC